MNLMRTQFRAADFGQVAKINIIRAKPKQASCAEMVLGSFVFCSCDSAVRFPDSENSTNVDSCYVRRRAECTSLGPGLQHLSLRSLTLVWLRRDVTRCFTRYFFQQSIRAQLLCVYSRMIRSHERRALGALLLFSRSEPASTNS